MGSVTSFDQSLKNSSMERFKGEKDRTYRVAFISEKLQGDMLHYVNKAYYSCLAQDSNKVCPFCAAIGPDGKPLTVASWRVVGTIVVWNSDPQGVLISPLGFKILAWPFGVGVFNQIKSIRVELGGTVVGYDLKLVCTDERRQQWRISTWANSILVMGAKTHPEIKTSVLDAYQKSAISLDRFLGRKVSEQEARALVEGRVAPSRDGGRTDYTALPATAPSASPDNLEAILGTVAAPSSVPEKTLEQDLFGSGQNAVAALLQEDIPPIAPVQDKGGAFPAPVDGTETAEFTIGKERGEANMKGDLLTEDVKEGKVPVPETPAEPVVPKSEPVGSPSDTKTRMAELAAKLKGVQS